MLSKAPEPSGFRGRPTDATPRSLGAIGPAVHHATFESISERLVRRQNAAWFRHLLDEIVMDENERQFALDLLTAEKQKQQDAGASSKRQDARSP